jgi:hypothetical protein
MFENEPISRVEWVDSRSLVANDYNPNMVMTAELSLLAFSILKTGWIQPGLITFDNVIIDCYHRSWLSQNDKALIKKYDYHMPVVRLELSEAERMMLTVRINRAKGVHQALKMHELVYKLHHELGVTTTEIMQGIGASKVEVETLLQEGVFSALNIPNHQYSKAWTPILK